MKKICDNKTVNCGFNALIGVLLITGSACAFQDKDDENKKEKKEDKKPEMVTVEERPLRIFESFDGVVVSSKVGEIKTDVKTWAELVVDKVTEEGTKVKSGENVLKFDTEKIDDAISEADFAMKSAMLDFEDAKLVAEQAKIELKLNNDLNEREMKNARDDYQYYQDVERKEREKDLQWSLKSADYSLEYAEEELNQLLKMYTEDELTEESEKIVLKRAQRGVDFAKRRQEQTKLRATRQENTTFPREDVRQEDSLKRRELTYEKTKTTLPVTLERAEIALKKADFALTKAKKKWSELRADRENMSLSAPMDGILYHGRCLDGKWIGATGGATRTLEANKKIAARKVVLTVIDPDSLVIRAEIPEDKVKHVEVGTTGTAILKSDDSIKLAVSAEELKRVPLSNGNFQCMFNIKDFDNPESTILPAMNCKISIGVYENDKALVVPKASVFTDDGFNYYVYTSKEKRKDVEVGYTSGDKIEITGGLKSGDQILKSKP